MEQNDRTGQMGYPPPSQPKQSARPYKPPVEPFYPSYQPGYGQPYGAPPDGFSSPQTEGQPVAPAPSFGYPGQTNPMPQPPVAGQPAPGGQNAPVHPDGPPPLTGNPNQGRVPPPGPAPSFAVPPAPQGMGAQGNAVYADPAVQNVYQGPVYAAKASETAPNPPPFPQGTAAGQPGVSSQNGPQGRFQKAGGPASPHPPQPSKPSGNPNYVPRKATKAYQNMLNTARQPKTLVMLALVLVYGILFSETILRAGLGLSVPLTVAVFCGISVWYCKTSGVGFSKPAMVLLLPIGLIAASFLFIDSGATHFFNMCLLFVLIPIQLAAMARAHTADLFSLESFKRAFLEVFCRPFSNLDMPFLAFSRKKEHDPGKTRTALGILIGVLVALPVGFLFIVLFSSADANFSSLFGRTFQFLIQNVEFIITDVFFGLIIALFCAALFIGLKGRHGEEIPKRETQSAPARKGGLPAAAVGGFLTVIVLIHAVFVGVQFQYLFGSGKGLLPNDWTYSQYARWGYVELSIALLIALILVVVVLYTSKRKENGRLPIYISLSLTALILCDFVVLASSIYRMLLYMKMYNLTVTRLLVLWSIILMGLCMLWLLGRVWFARFKVLRWCAVTVIAMVVVLNVANVDVLTAKVNVDRYLAGQTQEIDCWYLSKLSPAVAPQLERLLNTDVKEQARAALRVHSYKLEQKNWCNFAFPDLEARKVMERNNISSSRYYDFYSASQEFYGSGGREL